MSRRLQFVLNGRLGKTLSRELSSLCDFSKSEHERRTRTERTSRELRAWRVAVYSHCGREFSQPHSIPRLHPALANVVRAKEASVCSLRGFPTAKLHEWNPISQCRRMACKEAYA